MNFVILDLDFNACTTSLNQQDHSLGNHATQSALRHMTGPELRGCCITATGPVPISDSLTET